MHRLFRSRTSVSEVLGLRTLLPNVIALNAAGPTSEIVAPCTSSGSFLARSFSTQPFGVDSRLKICAAAFPFWSSPTRLLQVDPSKIRDFAIIAHVDHGKTTMMDRLLSFCGSAVTSERAMDSNQLEKERGITILSKYTSMTYKGFYINAVDTPGHADFGGEVERVLGMVDGCILLVDASEGPLSQTKFVLEKALRRGLRPIVVLNKVDRDSATPDQCGRVHSSIFDLFAQLGASEDQLDFPMLYASGRRGWAAEELPPGGQPPPGASMAPLVDAILRHVPPPVVRPEEPFKMLVTMLERDNYFGKVLTGRLESGRIRIGDRIKALQGGEGGGPSVLGEGRITKIFKKSGLARIELQEAGAGDIVSIAGCDAAALTSTLCTPEVSDIVPPGVIDPPTVSMVFGPNDSPMAGRVGKFLTGAKIGERLMQEAETSVSVRVSQVPHNKESWEVQARGELQLGLLIENMRREGYELSVSPPRVVLREDGEGGQMEPLEEMVCEVEAEHAGPVIALVTGRKGELVEMVPLGTTGRQRLVFEAPSRGLIGFRANFVSATRGSGICHRAFLRYDKFKGPLDQTRKGVLVSMAQGKTTAFALDQLQSRGDLFVPVGVEVYSGMIVGECARDAEMELNPTKEKVVSNVRSVQADEKIYVAPPRQVTLEDAIGYVQGDELIEVTPDAIRLRKRELDRDRREQARRTQRNAMKSLAQAQGGM